MAAGNLRSIGPIAVAYRAPSLEWTSSPSAHGIRACSISGLVDLDKGQQLAELVANPETQRTVGEYTGALEYIDFDGDVVGPFKGWYLLESFQIKTTHEIAFTGYTEFALDAAYLGVAVVGSAPIDGGTPGSPLGGVVDGGEP